LQPFTVISGEMHCHAIMIHIDLIGGDDLHLGSSPYGLNAPKLYIHIDSNNNNNNNTFIFLCL